MRQGLWDMKRRGVGEGGGGGGGGGGGRGKKEREKEREKEEGEEMLYRQILRLKHSLQEAQRVLWFRCTNEVFFYVLFLVEASTLVEALLV